MPRDSELERFDRAAEILPVRLRRRVLSLSEQERRTAEEFRMRVGRPMSVLLPEGERELDEIVESGDLETLCELATDFSRYSAVETMREGFLAVRGGFRVGLCGTAVMKSGVNTNLREFSSAAVRIHRQRKGIAEPILPKLFCGSAFVDTLILSPPGGGKTTLLRDLIRVLSDGSDVYPPHRVSLVDERGEIAVCWRGAPQMDVGAHTDVLDACPKAIGIPMVLRCMNPQIIAVDEITAQEDLCAISAASGCGVRLLATIHAGGIGELKEKPLYRQMLEQRIFRRAICIENRQGQRNYQVEELL